MDSWSQTSKLPHVCNVRAIGEMGSIQVRGKGGGKAGVFVFYYPLGGEGGVWVVVVLSFVPCPLSLSLKRERGEVRLRCPFSFFAASVVLYVPLFFTPYPYSLFL